MAGGYPAPLPNIGASFCAVGGEAAVQVGAQLLLADGAEAEDDTAAGSTTPLEPVVAVVKRASRSLSAEYLSSDGTPRVLLTASFGGVTVPKPLTATEAPVGAAW